MVGEQLFYWISENTATITSIVSIITVGIWGFYAHLLYRDYSNRNHPRILIQQSPGSRANSLCLLTNMSEKILNVTCVFVVGYGEKGSTYKKKITDYEQFTTETQTGQITHIKSIQERPLYPGDLICLGRFDSLLQKLENSESDQIHKLEIRVVAFFGARDEPIGAYRRFLIHTEQEGFIRQIIPNGLGTEQMTTFLQKREIGYWIQDCLNEEPD
ncbi:hypothetical protein [Methanohalophilus portucalensis]|uniref:Uncharacterized protein n=2 Tax=Methanohalophilus portucalensis TaxID=39664 RepID=A0A1X7P261_9EURY|nr:hypothetical protein [Methanohalophilus portucalensis]ATU08108.1 hypothetical protein BKM01_04550 [Methanohalophilus portucalensis]RNI10085.1 hypothetical protein EFE41_08520 [Methanohalophilus portucalensis FDF-1]SMH44232.1 hypothetical protein SAMN06264941_2039 [Methanohalophilus portucalensis FDF-1]